MYQYRANKDSGIIESITFCDGYFTLRYSNDILKDGQHHTVDELGSYTFDTYERTIMHELTHARIALGTWSKNPDDTGDTGTSRRSSTSCILFVKLAVASP